MEKGTRAAARRTGIVRVVAAASMLSWAGAAYARRTLTEFTYAFDTGGELHGFIHNAPGPGAAVRWRVGGALGSIGCLKVTGEYATADTRYEWVRAGDSTISFHYYVHGYGRLRVRLNTVRPADRKRYGRYGHHFINEPEPDRWHFVQLKLRDIPGDAKGKPKGYPELIFKTVTFIADNRSGGADSYMLLDNVRVGPAIEEKDIRVRTRQKRAFGKAARTLLNFETPAQIKLIRCADEGNVQLSHSTRWASQGKGAARLVCRKGKPWTAIELDKSLLGDWSKYDYLTFDLHSEDANFVRLCAELWDPATKGYATRATYGDQVSPQMKVGPAHKGLTRVRVGLRFARRNGKEGLSFQELRKADKIDLANVTKFKMWFTTTGLKSDYVVHMDNVRLLQEGALESNMKVRVPAGARAFDFGENSPLVEGFTEASVIDGYAPDKPFGFVDPRDLRASGRDWPDPLTGDFVGPAPEKSAGLEFRVRVPNGRYVAWVAAGFFPRPNVYVDLNVNGRMVLSGEMTGERFYSRRWYFRFLDTLYSEKRNALWTSCVAKAYPAYVVETSVKDGEFYVKATNAFLGALVLMPADRRAELDALARRIRSERIRYFYRDLYLLRPPDEPCAVTEKDFVLFAPAAGREIMPWSGVGKAEAAGIRRVASPGEAVCFQVAVRPFADAPSARLAVTDLAGPAGRRIAAKDVRIHLKRYLSNGENVRPWALYPTDTVPLEKSLTRAFWLRVRIPADAPAGKYTAAVTASAAGTTRRLPIEIQVYPVRLTAVKLLPLAIGYYYGPPDSGQFAMFDLVKDFQAQRDRMLAEQMALLHDYGMTSITIPTPAVKGRLGSGVSLDFAAMDKVARAAKAAGLAANANQPLMTYALSIGRSLGGLLAPHRTLEIGEELRLKDFGAAFTSGIMQTVEWAQRTDTPLVLWVVDEPRETPNPWNRNLDDTIGYLRLVGQVEEAVRMVTPMGDTNRGKDYMPMLDHLEIVATHATASSRKMIARGMSDPKVRLWIYNTGRDRLSNGLYLWRVGATGKHEWHFCQTIYDGDRYPGREFHNPFVHYEFTQVTVPAPLSLPGGLLPMEGLLTMSTGASDFRYVHTLQRAVDEAKRRGAASPAVARAEKLLASLRKLIPVLPKVKKLAGEGDLAQVGGGIESDGTLNLEEIKRRMAERIVELQSADKEPR